MCHYQLTIIRWCFNDYYVDIFDYNNAVISASWMFRLSHHGVNNFWIYTYYTLPRINVIWNKYLSILQFWSDDDCIGIEIVLKVYNMAAKSEKLLTIYTIMFGCKRSLNNRERICSPPNCWSYEYIDILCAHYLTIVYNIS